MNDIRSKYEIISTYRGYTYAIWLNITRGYRCGYVEIPKTHSLTNINFRELDIESVQLTFSGKIRDVSGHFIGWDHNHGWDGVDEDVIRAYYPEEQAEKLINEANMIKDHCCGFASSFNDVERECFNVIDELILKYPY